MNDGIRIVSVDVPFLQLVWLMSKIIVACIPALVVAWVLVIGWLFGFGMVFVFLQSTLGELI